MSEISITDAIGAIASVTIADDSLLAKAKLSRLISSTQELVKSLDKPVDHSDISSIALGGDYSSPSFLDVLPGLTVKAGANCEFAVLPAHNKLLFADDGFSPVIPIATNQCWTEFGVDVTAEVKIAAAGSGFGVALTQDFGLTLSTYKLFESAPLPSLKAALASSLEAFSVACTPKSIRSQPSGTVNACEISGSLTVSGSYSVPLSLDPLASAALPFNFNVSVIPTATAMITGAVKVFGDFVVRSYKIGNSKVRLGVYKKRGSTLSVSLTAAAGIAISDGSTDLLGTVLNAVLPGVDARAAGIPDDEAEKLNAVIKDALDRSVSIALNTSCAATNTHEAAVLYDIDLGLGTEAETDEALSAALSGDWTLLATLPSATRLRDVIVDTKQRKEKLSVNLFGILSASSVAEYLRRCTILRDENGRLSIIDKLEASRISVVSAPYLADSEKLRKALAQDFLATAIYAVVGSHLSLDLRVQQSFFVYRRNMSKQQFGDCVALGNFLGVIPDGLFAGVLASETPLASASMDVSVKFDQAAVMSLFFADPINLIPHSAIELERTGRDAMAALLDSKSDQTIQLKMILSNDQIWSEMDELGNPASFHSSPYLGHLNPIQLAVVSSNWISVAWWRNAMLKVAPALVEVLSAIAAAKPEAITADQGFMAARERLASVLSAVAKNTNADLVGGWGPAVMFALSGRHGQVTMDVAWNGNRRRFGRL